MLNNIKAKEREISISGWSKLINRSIILEDSPFCSIVCSSDGSYVAIGAEYSLKLLNIDMGEIKSLTRKEEQMMSQWQLQFSSDNQLLAAFSDVRRIIRVWHVSTRKLINQVDLQKIPIKQVSGAMFNYKQQQSSYIRFSPDNNFIAVYCEDNHLSILDLKKKDSRTVNICARALDYSPNNNVICSITKNSIVQIRNNSAYKIISKRCISETQVPFMKFLQTTIMGLWSSDHLKIFDSKRGKVLRQLRFNHFFTIIIISPLDKYTFLITSRDMMSTIKRHWNMLNGSLREIKTHYDIWHTWFSCDGKYILYREQNSILKIEPL